MIDWNSVKPINNLTIARMLTISIGVFTALDIGEAIVTQKYWVSINYVGIGRFAVAIGSDVSWGLKARNVKLHQRSNVKAPFLFYFTCKIQAFALALLEGRKFLEDYGETEKSKDSK